MPIKVLVNEGSSGGLKERKCALDEAFDLIFSQASNTMADMTSNVENDGNRSRKKRHIEEGRVCKYNISHAIVATHRLFSAPTGSHDGARTGRKRDESGSAVRVQVPSLAKSIAIDTIKSDIEKAMERRDARILLFNTLMRCLSILLDANLLKLTILKSSPARVVSTRLTHTVLMANNPEMFVDTIGHVDELVDNYEPTGKMLKVDSKQITNTVEEEKQMRLYKVLHLSDNYFTDQKEDVEKAVDVYLQQEYQKLNRRVSQLQTVPNDYFVLMSYLSDLHPLEDEKEG